jgi:hypothetical protein
MKPSDVSPALLHIINSKHLNGDMIAVNTSLDIRARTEPNDEFGAFKEYGIWDEDKSLFISTAIDYRLNEILATDQDLWTQ